MKHDWLSDEERNYLKSLDSGYVTKNEYKEYIDYTPKYEDYFIEKVDKKQRRRKAEMVQKVKGRKIFPQR